MTIPEYCNHTTQKEKLNVVLPMVEFQLRSLSSEIDGAKDRVGGWDVGPLGST